MQKQEFVGSRDWEAGGGGGSNSWFGISDVATELLHALHLYSPRLSVLVSTVFFVLFLNTLLEDSSEVVNFGWLSMCQMLFWPL